MLTDFRKDFKQIVNRHGWTYDESLHVDDVNNLLQLLAERIGDITEKEQDIHFGNNAKQSEKDIDG